MSQEQDFLSGTQETDEVSNVEDNAGTRQAGTDEEPSDIRSLLNKAIKDTSEGEGPVRERGPDGRFAKKGEVAGEPQEAPGQQQAQQPQQQDIRDVDTLVSKLPDEVRDEVRNFIRAREDAFNVWAQNAVNRVNGYDAVEQIIGPRREAWRLNGMSEVQALNQLFALSDFATRDPMSFTQWFADQHNIDLSNLPYEEFDTVDPQVKTLQQEVAELKRTLETNNQTSQQQQQQNEHQYLVGQVQQFSEEKDQAGNSVRPYFAEVASYIVDILPGLRQAKPNTNPQQLLQTAYDTAVWSNPTLRAKIIEAERLGGLAEKALKARNAGSSVIGAPKGETQVNRPLSGNLRDTIKAAWAEHS